MIFENIIDYAAKKTGGFVSRQHYKLADFQSSKFYLRVQYDSKEELESAFNSIHQGKVFEDNTFKLRSIPTFKGGVSSRASYLVSTLRVEFEYSYFATFIVYRDTDNDALVFMHNEKHIWELMHLNLVGAIKELLQSWAKSDLDYSDVAGSLEKYFTTDNPLISDLEGILTKGKLLNKFCYDLGLTEMAFPTHWLPLSNIRTRGKYATAYYDGYKDFRNLKETIKVSDGVIWSKALLDSVELTETPVGKFGRLGYLDYGLRSDSIKSLDPFVDVEEINCYSLRKISEAATLFTLAKVGKPLPLPLSSVLSDWQKLCSKGYSLVQVPSFKYKGKKKKSKARNKK